MSFRLTYATMFNPPEEMHERFERALATMRGRLGATHPMFIGGKDIQAARTAENASPIDNQLKIGRFPLANKAEVDSALAAAHGAFRRRRRGHRRARSPHAQGRRILEERVYEIAAALVLEVGKNRLEALGEARRPSTSSASTRTTSSRTAATKSTCRTIRSPDSLAQQERHAALWRLVRHRAIQFPDRARGRPDRRCVVTGDTVVVSALPIRPGRAACSPIASAMRACRQARSITSTALAPRSASSWCAIRVRPASRSRVPSRSAARSWLKWPPVRIHGPALPRWAARIRRS